MYYKQHDNLHIHAQYVHSYNQTDRLTALMPFSANTRVSLYPPCVIFHMAFLLTYRPVQRFLHTLHHRRGISPYRMLHCPCSTRFSHQAPKKDSCPFMVLLTLLNSRRSRGPFSASSLS
jgi:hypothetical protein